MCPLSTTRPPARRTGPDRVLHVEVGGSYGGSLRALENYLDRSEPGRFLHDVLLYYPTPRRDRIACLARRFAVLNSTPAPMQARPGAGGQAKRWVGRALGEGALRGLAISANSWMGLARSASLVRRLRHLITCERYDVVHVNNTFTYQGPTVAAAWLAGIPVIAHVRNPVVNNSFSRALASRIRSIAAVHGGQASALATWLPSEKIHVCYDGVSRPSADEAVSRLLRQQLLGAGTVLVGSAGRLDGQKGYENLVRAARQVAAARPDVRFAIAGEGPLHGALRKQIAEAGLGGVFYLCGYREDMGNFLNALDLFICSSHYEGLPIALLEAMLLGVPCVSTAVGVPPELRLPELASRVIAANQPEELARGILGALEGTPERVHLAELRRRAASLSDPEASARALDEAIASVCGREPVPASQPAAGAADDTDPECQPASPGLPPGLPPGRTPGPDGAAEGTAEGGTRTRGTDA